MILSPSFYFFPTFFLGKGLDTWTDFNVISY